MSTLPTGIHSPESYGNKPEDYDEIFLKRISEAKAGKEAALARGNDAQAQTIQEEIDELEEQYNDHLSNPS